MWINVYMGWCCLGVSGWEWEEVTKNFNHSGSLRIMSRVCEGMCGRESFLRFFAASTIAAWQRPEYWQRSAGFAGNTSVHKCQTQLCRNAKHKCAEMPNTNVQKFSGSGATTHPLHKKEEKQDQMFERSRAGFTCSQFRGK